MAKKYKFGKNGHLRLGSLRIECNITYRCNARCWGCNKAVGLAEFKDGDMTLNQMKKAVDQLLDQKVKIGKFTFCGGEPCLHRDLQQMIYEVDRLPTLWEGRVLTNGMAVTQGIRDSIQLPERFRWIVNPLDDIHNPYSGKNDPSKHLRGRTHKPFWISPHDVGMQADFDTCTVRGWCGIGLDASGWSMCGKASMFGRLLGIDPCMQEGNIEQHVATPIDEICKHCQYGLTKKQASEIYKKYEQGELDEMSETFVEAFRQHEEQPLIELKTF